MLTTSQIERCWYGPVSGVDEASGATEISLRDWHSVRLEPAPIVRSDSGHGRDASLCHSVIPDWPGISDWRESLRVEIADYITRSEGWDGYNAKRISLSAIRDAMIFVTGLGVGVPPPLDQPCSDGEVSLVWRMGDCFAEVGFPGDGTFYWYGTDGMNEASAESVPVHDGLPAELQTVMRFVVGQPTSILSSLPPRSYDALPVAERYRAE